MGHVQSWTVCAGSPGSAEMQSKKEGVIASWMHFQSQKTIPYCSAFPNYFCCQYTDSLLALCWWAAASNTFSVNTSKIKDGISRWQGNSRHGILWPPHLLLWNITIYGKHIPYLRTLQWCIILLAKLLLNAACGHVRKPPTVLLTVLVTLPFSEH